jgi:hypothetical protein
MYLVLLRCSGDDIPVFLTGDHSEAVRRARSLDASVGQTAEWEKAQPALEDLVRGLEIEWSDPAECYAVHIVTFANGRPVRCESADAPAID